MKKIMITLLVVAIGGVLLTVYLGFRESNAIKESSLKKGERVCTQEAMLCPDGSAVGRTGPNCMFAPCPRAETK